MRWIAVVVFVLSSTLNFLDRSILASVAPLVKQEFRINDKGYGVLISAFSLGYALSSPFTGYLLDRFGLNRVTRLLVLFWSVVSMITGLTRNFSQLLLCRISLGIGESGGIPAVAKMGGMYLPSEERALGSAFGQIGITLGGVLATVLAGWLAVSHGWRSPFLFTGLLGLFWIPLWHWTAKRIPPNESQAQMQTAPVPLDARLVILIVANSLWMTVYILWMNWTTLYLTEIHHLTVRTVVRYAALPPIASYFGGFVGGWLALRGIRNHQEPMKARLRVILFAALGCLSTVAVPYMPTPAWATAVICLSYACCLAGSVNLYTIPVDLYGPERAGMAVSGLVFGYGLMQSGIALVIGKLVVAQGYKPVCWLIAFPPLLAWLLLAVTQKQKSQTQEPAAAK